MTFANFYTPSSKVVGAVTNSNPGVVTTVEPHGYVDGYFVRFFFPLDVGMNQLAGKVVKVGVLDANNFSIGVNTSNFDSFAPTTNDQRPQVVPVGSEALEPLAPTKNNGNIIPEN